MPIKYNLTKYDILAEEFHELAQKKDTLTKDEETLMAEAALIALSHQHIHGKHTKQ